MKSKQKPAPRPAPKIDQRIACFRLRLDRSRIHRFGVYAEETIPAGRKVIEYTGERISRRESRKRYLKAAAARGKPLVYLFRVDKRSVIDGAVGGSGAEYINHSCAPNLAAYPKKGRINYCSLRRIVIGEELTVDYKFPRDGQKIRCRCGAANCRGTLNLK